MNTIQINTQPSFNIEFFKKILNKQKTNNSIYKLVLGQNSKRKIKIHFF